MRSIVRSPLAGAALATAWLSLATGCSPAPSPVETPPAPALVELPPPASAKVEPSPLASTAPAPLCSPAPPPIAPPPTPPDRASVAAGLDAFLVTMVWSDRTDLTLRAAPFLVRGRIWDLEHFGHAHPFYAHIGELEGAPSVSLSSSEAFVAFAQKAGVMLDTEVARAAYVRTYLSLDPEVLWLIESPADIRFTAPRDLAEVKLSAEDREILGEMLEDEIRRRKEVEARFVPAIKPLCLAGSGPFVGVIHANMRQRRLVRLEVTLKTSGAVSVRKVLLAENVPVTMVYP